MEDSKNKRPYEGEPVSDGEYQLGQLSLSGYGRVLKHRNDPDYLYNNMPVLMDDAKFKQLFNYANGHVSDFTAVVKNNEIIHVY